MKNKVSILHLSDIHLHDPNHHSFGKSRGNRKEIFEAFLKNQFLDHKGEQKIDLILITGDIYDGPYINSAKNKNEYKKMIAYGEQFLNHLSNICDEHKILFCYGNHDLNLYFKPESQGFASSRFHHSSLNPQIKKLIKVFKQYYNTVKKEKVNTGVKDAIDFDNLDNQEILFHYATFIQKFLNDKEFTFQGLNLQKLEKLLFNNISVGLPYFRSHYGFEEFYTFGVVYYEKLNLVVAIFNTSFQNVNSDFLDGRLSLGTYQVEKVEQAVNTIKKSHEHAYVITLMHNAFNSFGYSDVHNLGSSTGSNISRISRFSDLILCGHEHGELPPSLMHLESYMLKTGGLLNNDRHAPRNSFSVIELDFEKRELVRNLYLYDSMLKDFKLFSQIRGLENTPTNYYEFELYPKKAQKYLVNQQRDIEEYLEYYQNFGFEYTNGEEVPLDEYYFGEEFGVSLARSANSETFFNEKDKIIRSKILDVLTKKKPNLTS